MIDQELNGLEKTQEIYTEPGAPPRPGRNKNLAIKALVLLLIFIFGGGGGYMLGSRFGHNDRSSLSSQKRIDAMSLMRQINPAQGYEIKAAVGDVGMQLVSAGAIDLARFAGLYKQQNKPLTDLQMNILTKDTIVDVVINPDNAYFWLNFFWALGLTNQNEILTNGPMMAAGKEKVGNFASTGGWTLGTRKATDLYSSQKIIQLTAEQQSRLLEVASGVYRPCCNNPTHFPDCNHGMAMLGLLELMASQGADVNQMFEAAKYVTAFWYPQQILEVATFFKVGNDMDFALVDGRTVLSSQYSSISGYQAVHQWLSQNGLLEQAPGSGGSCGVG